MRTSGSVVEVKGYGRNDHLCLAYDHRAEFRGQRVCYVAGGDVAELRDEMR